jgi:uncharacterized membrane protein
MTSENNPRSGRIRVSLFTRRISLILFCSVLLVAWLIKTPPGLLGKSDAVAYAVCHRIGSHSFYLGERQFSLCARCSGQYLGFIWGFGLQAFLSKKRSGFPARWPGVLLGLFILLYITDGLNSLFQVLPNWERWTFYQPSNPLRLFSGLAMGLAISGFYYPLMGQTIWRDYSPKSALQGIQDWLIFLIGAVVIGLLVLWENPLISYYLILASTGGLLVLLTLLYTVIWILISKRENSYTALMDLSWWIVAGAGTALFQVILIDVLRFMLTGTWSGFLEY